MIFDTHAHYDSGAFDADRQEVLASMPGRGVELILDPAFLPMGSRRWSTSEPASRPQKVPWS